MSKRVLVAVRSLHIGGMERVAVTLCDALAAEGHEVHLLSFKKVRNGLRPEDPRVSIHRVDFDKLARLTVIGLVYDLFARAVLNLFIRKTAAYWRGVYYSIFFERFLRGLERTHGKFDLVIVRGQGTFEYLWRVRDPRLFAFVETIVPPTSSRPDFVRRAFFDRKNLVCVSSGVKQTVEGTARVLRFTPRSLRVISNPIPVDAIRTKAQEPCDDIPREPYIVTVSRLIRMKNHELLFDAYERANVPEKLVIVGSGDEEQRLKALVAARGLAERIIFVGLRANPYPWMKQARLFVLSSQFEGFGLVLAEALACGTPVVSVDCPGGIRDVLIEEQADFISRMDADDLAATIRRALANPPVVREEWVQRFEARRIAREIAALADAP